MTLYLFGEGFIWPNGYLFFRELCSLWQCYCNLSYQFNLRVGIMMNKCEVMCESCERGIIRIHVFVLVFFCFDCEVGSNCTAMRSILYADSLMWRMDVLRMEIK